MNFPQVELARAPGRARVVHMHRNVPCVMRDVNHIVSPDRGANIHAQVLSTNSEVGYLIMDLDQPVGAPVCEAMLRLPTTLRAKAL